MEKKNETFEMGFELAHVTNRPPRDAVGIEADDDLADAIQEEGRAQGRPAAFHLGSKLK